MSLHVTLRTPSPAAPADRDGRDETLATLRRALMLGVHLVDIVDIYAWGLDREFAPFGPPAVLTRLRRGADDAAVERPC